MRDISQRMVEALESHRDTIKETRAGIYRAPSRNDRAVRMPVDSAPGPVRSVSVEEYLRELAQR